MAAMVKELLIKLQLSADIFRALCMLAATQRIRVLIYEQNHPGVTVAKTGELAATQNSSRSQPIYHILVYCVYRKSNNYVAMTAA